MNESINRKIHVGSADLLGLEVEALTIFLEEPNKYKSKLVKRLVARRNIHITPSYILSVFMEFFRE